MSLVCSLVDCSEKLPSDGDYVDCFNCNSKYHYECAGVSKTTHKAKGKKSKEDWRCRGCRAPKSEEVSSKVVSGDEGELAKSFSEFRAEFRECFNSLKEEIQEIKDGLSNEVRELNLAVDTLKKQNKEKDRVIEALTAQVNGLDQYSRNKNFELENVEEFEDEEVEGIILNLAQKLGIELVESDIEAAHRLPTRNKDRPSRIIVQLASRKKRDKFIDKRRTVFTSNSLTGGTDKAGRVRVFINENLTPLNRELLWQTKKTAKESGFKFVWFTRGKILVRRDDNTKQVINIATFSDLEKLTVNKKGG